MSSDQALPAMDILRTDLRSGALERLVFHDFEPSLADDFVAQTDSTLYISRNSDGALLAVRKPD